MDFNNRPYSKWLDDRIVQLFEMDPESIAIVAINHDGTMASTYFNMHNEQRVTALRAIVQDALIEYIRVNASLISDLLREDDSLGE